MKRKKALAVLLTLGMALGMLSGCGSEPSADKAGQPADAAAEKDTTGETQEAKGSEGGGQSAQAGNVNAEGFPIVNEQITLRVFGQQGPVQAKWDTMGMWKKYQEMTNINLDFTDVLPAEGYDEKKSLMWASNEYPDIFVRAQLNNSEIVKYGSMGILAPLEDLIPVYAPNMQKLIDEDPAILSRITAPDGHIYALPAVFTLTAARDDKFWMNKSWLEQVGKEIPETVDELEEVLRSFKGVDFNGNGEADEYPMGISDASALIRRFAGVWGYQYQFGTYLEVKDGKVSTYLTDDGFKEELQWLAKMYGEGLIDPEILPRSTRSTRQRWPDSRWDCFSTRRTIPLIPAALWELLLLREKRTDSMWSRLRRPETTACLPSVRTVKTKKRPCAGSIISMGMKALS